MSPTPQRLAFDADGRLVLELTDGSTVAVMHPTGPVRADAAVDGTRWLVGGCSDSSGEPRIDLVDFGDPATLERWTVGADGVCREPQDVDVASLPAVPGYLLNPHLFAAARPRLNDFQIYSLLRLTAGAAAAAAYLDGCAAEHGPVVPAGCRLVVLFNHHYARNCRPIHDLYRRRFPNIDFVMPCVAPRHPQYHAYPFGSYQFHGLVHGYLSDRRRAAPDGPKAYLFIQDDVLLHPRLSAAAILALLADGHGGLFPVNHPYSLAATEWPWTARVANALERQQDPLCGNGFEGLTPGVLPGRLQHGVSDCFALRAELVPDFLDRLGPLVAANVFPEVSIPTALFAAVRAAGLSMAIRPGRFLWGADRRLARDPAYIADFLASDAALLHPLKIASGDETILRMIRAAEPAAD
jgi:hypothetical protein